MLVAITALWLPILVAAVLVFVASSVFHMVLPIHKSDYGRLPAEDAAADALRGTTPGTYMFPNCTDMKQLGEPEMIEKFQRGPVGFVTILPSGPPAMGRNLLAWFAYCLLVGIFAAYVGGLTLEPGTPYMKVFRVTGSIAILGYAVSSIPESIWKGQSWGTTAKFVFDGIVYGLLTAGTFAWLWPE